jgi:hypothetical protein
MKLSSLSKPAAGMTSSCNVYAAGGTAKKAIPTKNSAKFFSELGKLTGSHAANVH